MFKKSKVRLYEISKYDDINQILKYSPKTNFKSFKKFMEAYYKKTTDEIRSHRFPF